MATIDPINVGIAGLGRSGWDIHAKLLDTLPAHYQITAVVDEDDGRRQEARDRFGCETYTEFASLLDDDSVELIVVALPSHFHADLSIAALAANKHVVCEKPMAATLQDADRMVQAAERSDHILTIFQQRRYNPEFVKVKEIIDSGILGEIIQIRISESKFTRRWDWQTLQKFDGGTLNNTGAHFVDQALQLFGPAEPEVFCELQKTLSLGDADDHAKLILTADGAPTIDIEISSCCAYPPETWNVFGTQGGLHGTTKELHWKWIVPNELENRELDLRPTPDRSYNRDILPWHEAHWQMTGELSDHYAGFYRDLYVAIRHNKPVAVTPQSVRRVVWLLEECHRRNPLPQTIH